MISKILLLIVSIIAIIVIVVIIALIVKRKTPPEPPNQYNSPIGWGKESASTDSSKNTCQLYVFPVTKTTIDGRETYITGTPTLNTDYLNNATGASLDPTNDKCLDTDEIVAKQVQRTCQELTDHNVPGATNLCKKINGEVVKIGGIDTYYSSKACSNYSNCAGKLSVVSFNYQVPNVAPRCLTNSTAMIDCDPSDMNQLFRVTRINVGQNPKTLNANSPQNGILAQILDRRTGLCLQPTNTTTNVTYNSNYGPNCTPPLVIGGVNVEFSKCSGGQYPGYVWALLPPISWNAIAGAVTTRPQVVYVGNIDMTKVPKTDGSLEQNTKLIEWLVITNSAQSLYYSGTIGDPLILTGFNLENIACFTRGYNSSYINLSIYNLLVTEELCLGNSGDPISCLSF